MRVIIAGGRDFAKYSVLERVCSHKLSKLNKIAVVSGECDGADRLGELFALKHGHPIDPYPP
jgi:hypothetical protein